MSGFVHLTKWETELNKVPGKVRAAALPLFLPRAAPQCEVGWPSPLAFLIQAWLREIAVDQNWVPKMACPGKWNSGLKPAVRFLVLRI